ncbi:FecR family protein [Sphingobacterium lactis]|uniref:FecR family protein n=1 Tax=Sphingobacterium lactis TaxID=797291 RepID=UPI003F7E28B4
MFIPTRELLIRYFLGQASELEIDLVTHYLALGQDEEFINSCLEESMIKIEEAEVNFNELEYELFLNRLNEKKYPIPISLDSLEKINENQQITRYNFSNHNKVRSMTWRFLGIIAACFICFLLIDKVVLTRLESHDSKGKQLLVNDIPPAKDQATLTLIDGSTIALSEIKPGNVIDQNGILIEKMVDGTIKYIATEEIDQTNLSNSISTPNGGTYQVILPDGSKAWLNASSTLKYPLKFSDQERRVEMTGEIYFEVEKLQNISSGKRIPFYVNSPRQELEVLGTKFNIKAYPTDLESKTSLLEGRVQIKSIKSGVIKQLIPGDEAIIDHQFVLRKGDFEESLAWRTGDFVFNNEPLPEVLKTLSRWYNVETECPPAYKNISISGMISRRQNLSSVLEGISSTQNFQLKLKERRIIVIK